jgi:hypothetical protein
MYRRRRQRDRTFDRLDDIGQRDRGGRARQLEPAACPATERSIQRRSGG